MKTLRPIKITVAEFEILERRIKLAFKKSLYHPLLRALDLSNKTIKNSKQDLLDAIEKGKVTYRDGTFAGEFSASVSKELYALGATYRRGKFHLEGPSEQLLASITAASARFAERVAAIDGLLKDFDSAAFAKSVKVEDLFDRALNETEKDFQKSIRGITVAPKLSAKERRFIADEWRNNMEYWIQTFTEKEITELRDQVSENVAAGNRFEAMTHTIADSYGVTSRKARFLARQETNLLMAKYKETRYASAGVVSYIWQCVNGSPNHPVRPGHLKLNGTKQRFDKPPNTADPGQPAKFNNPGEDFNCRCYARPIVE